MGGARSAQADHRLAAAALLRDHLTTEGRGSVAETLKTISPADGRIYVERTLAGPADIAKALATARLAQGAWRTVPLAKRMELIEAFVKAFEREAPEVAREISWQMGRPIRHSPGEIRGLAERARYMAGIAADALADTRIEPKQGFTRFIRHDPLGVVFVVAPWNYPLLTAVNAVVPAILAGNAVLLKHSHQTPLAAERFGRAFREAGLPEGVFQYLHLDHGATEGLIASPEIDFVAFTGSVSGGQAVSRAAGGRFIGLGLELGGKDPAYVRPDANLDHAVENLVDGAFFNAGQSCCAIERIYVHRDLYRRFVDGFVDLTKRYQLGDPLEESTTLGPMVRASAADHVRRQIHDAVRAGAKALIDAKHFPAAKDGTPYLAPQVLIEVDHRMAVMTEESFGPVIAIMQVDSDDAAIRLMNDSQYGLTAAIWTMDEDKAIAIGDKIETGTWFMNRCDYLDPALAWTGVKDSGRGCTLSRLGFSYLTRPKSFHLRTTL
ncbi:MAG: aldehyde dehydrogenase family protein [Proteobacteria bacterium]|nr:aldehyde dehydrogenase family protein [Pseudomonadota bacterium]